MPVTQAFTAPGGHDAALTRRDDDLLDRWPVAKLVYRMITATPLGWSTRLGLYGPWGSGKTSVLNFLQLIAEEKGDIIVRLPAWRTSGEQEFIVQFYLALAEALQRSGVGEPFKHWTKRQSKKIADILEKAARKTADLKLPESASYSEIVTLAAGAAGLVFEKLSEILQLEKSDLDALRGQLGDRRIIVFVDDLDRADPRMLPTTLLTLRDLLDWPGFVFVLAFDKDVVGKALRSYSEAFGESAQHFLDKIIDVPVTLPEPSPKQVQRMVARNLKDCCPFLPDTAIAQTAEWFPTNPRQAKRICRSLSVFGAAADRHAEGQLDWRGIILQTLLRETEPKVAQVVEEHMLGVHSDFGASMFGNANNAKQEQHKQAALNAAQCPKDEVNNKRLWKLIEELGHARSKLSLANIHYEMSLAFREVEFTIPEFSRLVKSWGEYPSAQTLNDFIREAASRSDEGEVAVASAMLNMANFQYGEQLGRTASLYSREAFERAMRSAAELLRLIEFCYSTEIEGAMSTARGDYEVCIGFIRSFFASVAKDASAPERALRERELRLAAIIAAQCDDPQRLYLDAEPIQGTLRVPAWEVARAYEHYVDALRTVLAPPLIHSAIQVFALPNGVANALGQDDARLKWVLTEERSPLYTQASKDLGCAALKELIGSTQELGAREILAKNALSYLGAFTDRWESSSTCAEQATRYLEYIQLAWQALCQLEPTIQTRVYLKKLKSQLEKQVASPGLLDTPDWWSGKPDDIEHELRGI
ncbi:KAP family P-loop NTPase fold protein [Pseudomonas sp. St29]|uniref:KAP family P-loop NTPase fold protein n=1 Tax=Pseudomonas sp. St29 TaxID=1500687 RepID=UPI0005FC8AF1|nr:P-loop NTPase fold protein [Pseudomonas sp. St29]BAQ80936.1 KAP P-loop domain protein [Pseudomonas sp. St29]